MAQIYMMSDHARLAGKPHIDQSAPGWATGLRQLYKAASQEPLPAEFGDLLVCMERRCRSAKAN